jgi:hypothetical protein
VALAVGQDVPFVGQVSRNFVLNPSLQGTITGITYNIDLETLNAEGATYEPLLEQDGKFFTDFQTTGNASPNSWLNENIVLALSDFEELTISPTHQLILNPASKPDFSSTGLAITFGYEVTAGGGGFFTSITGIDNDPIVLTVTPIPEPDSVALFGAALAVVVIAGKTRQAFLNCIMRLPAILPISSQYERRCTDSLCRDQGPKGR